MQEHPIPQDITGYRFHIVGSMTLKQFGEVFLGVIFAAIFYNTNLISIIKWPPIMLSVGIGAAAAFLPIEERPLDHWIITFFKVMYKPTKFYWRRIPQIPEAFLHHQSATYDKDEPTLDLNPAKRQRIKEYVSSIPEIKTTTQDYSTDELSRMQNILSSFTSVQVSQTTITPAQPVQEKPRFDVRVRKMRKPAAVETIIFEDTATIQTQPQQPGVIYEDHKQYEPELLPTKKSMLPTDQVAHNIQIPEERTVTANSQEEQGDTAVFNQQNAVNDVSQKAYIQPEALNTQQTIAVAEASYNQDLPFPIKPSEPNKVVGMVLSQNNDLLVNSIVEIQTPEGSISRAVKTNALGQFFITTALKPGDYNVVVEKAGFQFEPHHLKVDNTIIPPMEIRSVN